jgi:SOS-response transcriptional repressor LexA
MSNVREVKRSHLTLVQAGHLAAIRELVAEKGMFPTIQEIGERTGKYKAPIQWALKVLTRKGYLQQISDDTRTPRNWRLPPVVDMPDLQGAHALRVKESQNINWQTVPAGAFVLEKDDKFIGCWIPAECIGGGGDGEMD